MTNMKYLFKLYMKGLLMLSVGFIFLSLKLSYECCVYIMEFGLFKLNGSSMSFICMIDWVSALFLGVVSLISGSVVGYCNYYMMEDLSQTRFLYILSGFVLSMFMLIVSPNFMSMLLGWDGLGLTSYFLVCYYQNESSNNAGMLTVLSNRIGDVGILLAIALFSFSGCWSYVLSYKMSILCGLALLVAAATKSAQIPFSAWLPAAMAAPTPVSALVHSSTLVTAGVYVLIRLMHMFEIRDLMSGLVFLGLSTMIMSGLSANFEEDLKKVIALSTLSQLGLMMLILGLGKLELAFFHLITHALFKSSLFMSAGYIIHSTGGSQDSRGMNSVGFNNPILSMYIGYTNLALMGTPFLAGFYSKDLILENLFEESGSKWLFYMSVVATSMTVMYSLRLIYKSFSDESSISGLSSSSDMSSEVWLVMSGLISLSILGGFMVYWGWYFEVILVILTMSQKYMIITSLMMGIFMIVYVMKFMINKNSVVTSQVFQGNLLGLWNLSSLSKDKNIQMVLVSASTISGMLDKGWLELYGAQGSSLLGKKASIKFQMAQVSSGVGIYLLGGLLVFILVFL